MSDQRHILLVEDEEHLAVGIKFNLQAEGYRVTTTPDGATALRLIEENAFDLVILDLMLPGMSGYTVCERLREAGHDIPVLILSARTLSEDRARGFTAGADQYLTKPFELDELLSRLTNLLARHEGRHGRLPTHRQLVSYEFGDAKINFDTYEVTVGDKPLRMTQLELKLLRYLVENEGRVVSRHELLEEVWETAGDITTRAPDQFIRRLRKAFEPDPAHPIHFLTIRDAGYRFVAQPKSDAE